MANLNNLKIIKMLTDANQHVQYPKLRLLLPNGDNMQLHIAGSKSKYAGNVMITNGKGFSAYDNKWYGSIQPNGQFNFAKDCNQHEQDAVREALNLFASDPVKYATLYGKDTGSCMFCGRQLTDPQSIAVGYGPICAEHYGLPHGEMDAEVAKEFSQIELEMPEHIELVGDPAQLPPTPVETDELSDYLQMAADELATALAQIELVQNAIDDADCDSLTDAIHSLIQAKMYIAYNCGCEGK